MPTLRGMKASAYSSFQVVYVGWYECTGKARAEWRDRYTQQSHQTNLHVTLKAAKAEMEDWLRSRFGECTIEFRKLPCVK